MAKKRQQPCFPAEMDWKLVVIMGRLLWQTKQVLQGSMTATQEILQGSVNEVGERLRIQINEELEAQLVEHRRYPHVGGQRVDDLQRAFDGLDERIAKLEQPEP